MLEATFVEPGKVEWREAPAPSLQGDGEALVRPLAVATCDIDSEIIRGNTPYPGPFPLGHEFIAEVIDVGDAVKNVKPGERYAVPFQVCCGVCANCRRGLTANCLSSPVRGMYGLGAVGGSVGGALSDVVRVPFADFMLVPLPDGVDPVESASISDNIVDAYRTIAPYLEPGDDVLVVGGQGTRSMAFYACQIAIALGAGRVDYVDDDPKHLQIAAKLGANAIAGDGKEVNEPYPARFPRRMQQQYPVTFDGSCHPAGLGCAIRSTAPGGHCTATGIYWARTTPMPLLDMYDIGLSFHHGRAAARALMPAALELIATGRFDPSPVTDLHAKWDDAPAALMELPIKLIVTR